MRTPPSNSLATAVTPRGTHPRTQCLRCHKKSTPGGIVDLPVQHRIDFGHARGRWSRVLGKASWLFRSREAEMTALAHGLLWLSREREYPLCRDYSC